MMLESAFAYLGFQFAKFQFRSDVEQIQPMTNFLSNARNVLIALPTSYDYAILAGNALRQVRRDRDYLQLTVINNSTWATSLADFPHCEVIRIDPSDLNRFSLPRRPLLQRILHTPFDVAVDLNLDFVLHTAYICRASRANVRVGFAHPAADVFFNVKINLNREHAPQAIYEKFAACLSMF